MATVKGVRWARRSGVSPKWMWFGINPLGAFIAYAIIRGKATKKDGAVAKMPAATSLSASTENDYTVTASMMLNIFQVNGMATVGVGFLAAACALVAAKGFSAASESRLLEHHTTAFIALGGCAMIAAFISALGASTRGLKALRGISKDTFGTLIHTFSRVYGVGAFCVIPCCLFGALVYPLFLPFIPVVWWRVIFVRLCRALYDLYPSDVLKQRTNQCIKNGWILMAQCVAYSALGSTLYQRPDSAPLLWAFFSPLLAFFSYYLGYETLLLHNVRSVMLELSAGRQPASLGEVDPGQHPRAHEVASSRVAPCPQCEHSTYRQFELCGEVVHQCDCCGYQDFELVE